MKARRNGVSIPQGTIKRCVFSGLRHCLPYVSIPQGTIKSTGCALCAKLPNSFQFHKVRLKENISELWHLTVAWFQFHKVRLKACWGVLPPPLAPWFQFHKVRLKESALYVFRCLQTRFNSTRYD